MSVAAAVAALALGGIYSPDVLGRDLPLADSQRGYEARLVLPSGPFIRDAADEVGRVGRDFGQYKDPVVSKLLIWDDRELRTGIHRELGTSSGHASGNEADVPSRRWHELELAFRSKTRRLAAIIEGERHSADAAGDTAEVGFRDVKPRALIAFSDFNLSPRLAVSAISCAAAYPYDDECGAAQQRRSAPERFFLCAMIAFLGVPASIYGLKKDWPFWTVAPALIGGLLACSGAIAAVLMPALPY